MESIKNLLTTQSSPTQPQARILGLLQIDKKSAHIIKNEKFLNYINPQVKYSSTVRLATKASNLWDKAEKLLPEDFGGPKILRLTQRRLLKRNYFKEFLPNTYDDFCKYYVSEEEQEQQETNSSFDDDEANKNFYKVYTNIDVIPISNNSLCLVEYEVEDVKSKNSQKREICPIKEKIEQAKIEKEKQEQENLRIKQLEAKQLQDDLDRALRRGEESLNFDSAYQKSTETISEHDSSTSSRKIQVKQSPHKSASQGQSGTSQGAQGKSNTNTNRRSSLINKNIFINNSKNKSSPAKSRSLTKMSYRQMNFNPHRQLSSERNVSGSFDPRQLSTMRIGEEQVSNSGSINKQVTRGYQRMF